ncbi:MAG TPA: Ppx/GppA phosphatase family protein [Actinotalea caeni]|uniref:Ppx/GppA phosphatase family protein n=1 Tax=Actinotalea caeni TaxID=1348467 RepID=UPI002B4B65B8|nr:Ppx/GppA phosphatase family protein [Actinotalea caeni]HLV55207.1 Ppx/GppA phosphatase family protein [Actinotalea caeni]
MTRVAAIDCGTNSIRLLVADATTGPDGAAELSDVVRLMEVVRLGQGVDRTGELAPEALERTLAATDTYAALCEEHGVEAVRFVATSATRDARNRDVFVDGVRERLGVEPEVISGTEEAALSFAGAVRALAREDGPALVVDIGGGSTELVLGDVGPTAGPPTASTSLDMGCVRMTERHLATDPPTAEEIAAAERDVRDALESGAAVVPLGGVRTLVGVAGSVTTVTAHALHLDRYRPEAINGARLPVADVLAACEELLHATRAERAALPYMHPGRVDVIGAGALVWAEVVRRVAADSGIDTVVASEHDILDGIALSVLGRLA